MKIYNPYTRVHIDYPLDFDMHKLNYHIQHETLFSDRFAEWAVAMLESGDMIYLPYGQNMCPDIYIVTRKFLNKEVAKPYGIYTIPMNYFTRSESYEKIY